MSACHNAGIRAVTLFVGLTLLTTLFGCPPPKSETSAAASGPSKRYLDSLRADSAKRCRMHSYYGRQNAHADLKSDAVLQFEKALRYCKNSPKYVEVEYYYGKALDKWGKRDSASVHLREAGKLDTNRVDLHFWLYKYYYDKGHYKIAIDELLMAARHQDDADSRIKMFKSAAGLLESEGMVEKACEVYTYLQSIVPGDPDIARAMVKCSGDNPLDRMAALKTAYEADTTNLAIGSSYAKVAEEAGSYDVALDLYLKFAHRDLDNIEGWVKVQGTAKRLGKSDVVFQSLKEMARLEPGNPERTAALADEYFAQNRLSEGSKVLLPKLRAHPNNVHLLYLAGVYYSRRSASSKTDLKRALSYLCRAIRTNDLSWRPQALHLYNTLLPPMTNEEINKGRFFEKQKRIHWCDIPERKKERAVIIIEK
jgi:tetratricopeptide (TPR) repeat protein